MCARVCMCAVHECALLQELPLLRDTEILIDLVGMCVYVCMFVCVQVYLFIYLCMCVCLCVYVCLCMSVNAHVCICACVCYAIVCVYVCACVFVHECAVLLPMYLHVDIRADKCLL